MHLSKPFIKNQKFAFLLQNLLSKDIPQADVHSVKNFPLETIFIDTREENEYSISSIDGAIKIGFKNFDLNGFNHISKDTWIVVFCSVGVRSEKICRQLISSGFSNVYNLYGGIFEWINQGHFVVDENGNKADSIHAYSRAWGIWVSGLKKVYNKNL